MIARVLTDIARAAVAHLAGHLAARPGCLDPVEILRRFAECGEQRAALVKLAEIEEARADRAELALDAVSKSLREAWEDIDLNEIELSAAEHDLAILAHNANQARRNLRRWRRAHASLFKANVRWQDEVNAIRAQLQAAEVALTVERARAASAERDLSELKSRIEAMCVKLECAR